MAIMINCAQDFTFDLFMEDASLYNQTPFKGVYPNPNSSDRKKFMVWFKNLARDFRNEWKAEYGDVGYVTGVGFIGDAFEYVLNESCFSDYYKDVYGQRPHLERWYYIQAIGMHHEEDVGRTFCSHPVEDAIKSARYVRSVMEERAEQEAEREERWRDRHPEDDWGEDW